MRVLTVEFGRDQAEGGVGGGAYLIDVVCGFHRLAFVALCRVGGVVWFVFFILSFGISFASSAPH